MDWNWAGFMLSLVPFALIIDDASCPEKEEEGQRSGLIPWIVVELIVGGTSGPAICIGWVPAIGLLAVG